MYIYIIFIICTHICILMHDRDLMHKITDPHMMYTGVSMQLLFAFEIFGDRFPG